MQTAGLFARPVRPQWFRPLLVASLPMNAPLLWIALNSFQTNANFFSLSQLIS
uniref:Uncharacterized protein n=1 Tax=Anguilla anguilla TaxID=7936 RepID=A0A0E9SL51_ANGAN